MSAARMRAGARALRWIMQTRPFDKLMARRAVEICGKLDLASLLPHGAVYLEIGSGSGHVLEQVAASPACPTCIGLDLTWRPIERVERRLRRSAADRWLFLRADATRLPLPDRSVDIVGICFVLHHIPGGLHGAVLDEVGRVLRDDGMLALYEDVPATRRQWRRVEFWDRVLNFESPWEPHFYRSIPAWEEALGGRGFVARRRVEFDRMAPDLGVNAVPHAAWAFVRTAAARR